MKGDAFQAGFFPRSHAELNRTKYRLGRFSRHVENCKERAMKKYLVSALVGAVGIIAFTATNAAAAIVCNGEGDCWHVKEKYDYRPDWGLQVYPDDWKWEGDKYRWREHEGRGYWNKGVWIGF